MDKYEYRIKAEQIRKLAEQEDFASAMKIANTIDWNRVRSIPMLCLVGEIYEKNNMLEESRDVMLIAYDRHPYGRMIIYSLAELSIRLEDYIDAVEYYKEFVQVAPRDTGRYILQYKLYEAQHVGLQERIAVLEEFKRHEYIEKWAFELAYLYHRAGMGDKCVSECDELILWFSDGKYVEKAIELKMIYAPLTEEQKQKYESRNDVQIEKSIAAVEAVAEKTPDKDEIEVKPLNYGIYDTVNLQKELAKSMKQIMNVNEDEAAETTKDNIKKLVEESKNDELLVEEEKEDISQTTEVEQVEEETIADEDVVAEAAKLIQQITGNDKEAEEPKKEVSVVEETEIKEYESQEELGKTKVVVFDINDAPTKILPVKEIQRELEKQQEEPKEVVEPVLQELTKESPTEEEKILSVSEKEMIEKQATGQMSIEEVLQEWERIKSEVEEKKKDLEDAKEKVISETENIMDKLSAVMPENSPEMQKMMGDGVQEVIGGKESQLQTFVEVKPIFEEVKEELTMEADSELEIEEESIELEVVDDIEESINDDTSSDEDSLAALKAIKDEENQELNEDEKNNKEKSEAELTKVEVYMELQGLLNKEIKEAENAEEVSKERNEDLIEETVDQEEFEAQVREEIRGIQKKESEEAIFEEEVEEDLFEKETLEDIFEEEELFEAEIHEQIKGILKKELSEEDYEEELSEEEIKEELRGLLKKEEDEEEIAEEATEEEVAEEELSEEEIKEELRGLLKKEEAEEEVAEEVTEEEVAEEVTEEEVAEEVTEEEVAEEVTEEEVAEEVIEEEETKKKERKVYHPKKLFAMLGLGKKATQEKGETEEIAEEVAEEATEEVVEEAAEEIVEEAAEEIVEEAAEEVVEEAAEEIVEEAAEEIVEEATEEVVEEAAEEIVEEAAEEVVEEAAEEPKIDNSEYSKKSCSEFSIGKIPVPEAEMVELEYEIVDTSDEYEMVEDKSEEFEFEIEDLEEAIMREAQSALLAMKEEKDKKASEKEMQEEYFGEDEENAYWSEGYQEAAALEGEIEEDELEEVEEAEIEEDELEEVEEAEIEEDELKEVEETEIKEDKLEEVEEAEIEEDELEEVEEAEIEEDELEEVEETEIEEDELEEVEEAEIEEDELEEVEETEIEEDELEEVEEAEIEEDELEEVKKIETEEDLSMEETQKVDEYGDKLYAGEETSEEAESKEDLVKEIETKLTENLSTEIESIAGRVEEDDDEPIVLDASAESFKKVFKYFTEIEGVSEQIIDALGSIDEISDKGNVIIMGDTATGKTTLAVNIIKAAKKAKNITGNKVARITGEAMNSKDIQQVIESSVDGVLIVEEAAVMNAETVVNFSRALDEMEEKILVILEGEKEKMLLMLEQSAEFREKFTAVIDLPPYTNTDLVSFAKSYAKEKDYVIEEMGVLALYSKLAEMQFETDFIPTLYNVKELIDEAIDKAGKRKVKSTFGKLFSKRKEEASGKVLKEKDFLS